MPDRVEISGVVFSGELVARQCVKCGQQYAHAGELGRFELVVTVERLRVLRSPRKKPARVRVQAA